MAVRNKCSAAKREFAAKLRRNLSFPERILWKRLCRKKLGVWFYSQSVLYGFIVDFWCPKCNLAIEVDGKHHSKQKRYDANRDKALAGKGIVTIRFTASDVNRDVDVVVGKILAKVKNRLK
jgi:very-short-patch-repair endonuclease